MGNVPDGASSGRKFGRLCFLISGWPKQSIIVVPLRWTCPAIFGKCDSPFGHGHNYVLEVTVEGPIDQETGMVFDLVALDGLVEKEVLERFDHTNLNLDVENFQSRVPTTENVCVEIFNLLKDKVDSAGPLHAAHLARVRLEETNSNFFEYEGERSIRSRN